MKWIDNCKIVVTGSGVQLSLMVVQPNVDVVYHGLMTYKYRTFLDWFWQWSTEVLTEKPATAPFFPPQISRELWVMDCVQGHYNEGTTTQHMKQRHLQLFWHENSDCIVYCVCAVTLFLILIAVASWSECLCYAVHEERRQRDKLQRKINSHFIHILRNGLT